MTELPNEPIEAIAKESETVAPSGAALPPVESDPPATPPPPTTPMPPAVEAPAAHASDEWAGFYSLDPRCIPMDRWVGLVGSPFLSALVVSVLLAVGEWWLKWGWPWVAYAALYIAVFGAMVWFSLMWPVWEFRRSRWRCDGVALEIHRGIWWRRRISVPLSRIQHVDVSQGPWQRRYGLAKFTVYTAGSHHSSVDLNNVAWETAHWLRDRLMVEREVIDAV